MPYCSQRCVPINIRILDYKLVRYLNSGYLCTLLKRYPCVQVGKRTWALSAGGEVVHCGVVPCEVVHCKVVHCKVVHCKVVHCNGRFYYISHFPLYSHFVQQP